MTVLASCCADAILHNRKAPQPAHKRLRGEKYECFAQRRVRATGLRSPLRRLLEGDAEKLTHKAVALALKGNVACLRLCLDRIVPPRRDRLVNFTLPAMNSASDASKAMVAITTAVASGDLTPAEAGELARLIDAYVKVIETSDIERRIQILEEKAARDAQ